jgi:hypothetical protein
MCNIALGCWSRNVIFMRTIPLCRHEILQAWDTNCERSLMKACLIRYPFLCECKRNLPLMSDLVRAKRRDRMPVLYHHYIGFGLSKVLGPRGLFDIITETHAEISPVSTMQSSADVRLWGSSNTIRWRADANAEYDATLARSSRVT